MLLPEQRTLKQAFEHEYWVKQNDWQACAVNENATWHYIGATP